MRGWELEHDLFEGRSAARDTPLVFVPCVIGVQVCLDLQSQVSGGQDCVLWMSLS